LHDFVPLSSKFSESLPRDTSTRVELLCATFVYPTFFSLLVAGSRFDSPPVPPPLSHWCAPVVAGQFESAAQEFFPALCPLASKTPLRAFFWDSPYIPPPLPFGLRDFSPLFFFTVRVSPFLMSFPGVIPPVFRSLHCSLSAVCTPKFTEPCCLFAQS